MQDIYVDLQGLAHVHRTLNGIRHDLSDFNSNYTLANAQAMGHPRVIRALNDFVYGWSDGREVINTQLEVANKKIEAAVEAYTQAESEIGGLADNMKGGMQ